MLEHDVGVVADERADLLAEAAPLALVLGVLVGPELVVLGAAVDRLCERADGDHEFFVHRPGL